MFIDCIEIMTAKLNLSMLEPRSRYRQYFTDLCRQHQLEPDPYSWNVGAQKSYIELVEPLLMQLRNKGFLQEVDCLCLCPWTPEFDPDYSSYGQYLIKHWAPTAKLLHVGDQGMLNLLTAVRLAAAYLSAKFCKKFLIIVPEQTTIPGYLGMTDDKPQVSGAAALLFSLESNVTSWQLINTSVLPEEAFYLAVAPDSCQHKTILYRQIGLYPFCQQLFHALHDASLNSLSLFFQDIETKRYGCLNFVRESANGNI